MGYYYFLASLLPDLQIGHIPSIGFGDFQTLLKENLSKNDLKKVRKVLSLIDLENIRALWTGEPLDPKGNYNAEQLNKAVADHVWPNGEEFSPLLTQFLQDFSNVKDRLSHFPWLISRFLREMVAKESGFLKKYFDFEREFRLVLMGFRAKLLHRDLSVELQFEDSQDPIVVQILAQKDAKTFEPPFGYEELKPVFEAYKAFPLELHKVLNEYKFQKVEQLSANEQFSIDRILSYLVQLIIVENWLALDEKQGLNVVNAIVKDTK